MFKKIPKKTSRVHSMVLELSRNLIFKDTSIFTSAIDNGIMHECGLLSVNYITPYEDRADALCYGIVALKKDFKKRSKKCK